MMTRIVRTVRMQAPVVARAMMAGVVIAVLGPSPALHAAGIDAFLKIENQTGQVVDTDAEHSWVEVFGFTQGVESETTIGSPTGGAGAGKMQGKACTLSLGQDRCLASSINACAKGESRDLTLQVVRETSGGFAMMTELHFENAFVSSVKCEMSGGEQPVFAVGLEYVRLTWTTTWYPNTGPGGGIGTARGAGFDFAENRIFETVSTVLAPGDYAEGSGPGPVDPDGDHDGMLDAWETANGLNPANAADAGLDRDKDGQSNKDEFLAGTNPSSGGSFFRATMSSATPGSVRLSWNSVAGKSYKVWASQELGGGFAVIATVNGLAGETSHTASMAGGRFFKVTVGE
ncbi:type VI secretion system tube protein Hcp [Luteolibacter sp. Populi]|uniref:type VI secretion system tube protein Hcp n=1 Tax=Luteolibacter sp. Populi TaxID=3230487 RepID=UPI003465DBA1